MATEVRLPDLGEGIKSAKLVSWLKREGDVIRAGEPIAELETDKTSMELEAPESGVLQKIHVAASSEDVAIDTILAIIDADQAETPFPAGDEELQRSARRPEAYARDVDLVRVDALRDRRRQLVDGTSRSVEQRDPGVRARRR